MGKNSSDQERHRHTTDNSNKILQIPNVKSQDLKSELGKLFT